MRKYMNSFRLTTFSFNYFEVRVALSFWFLLSVSFDIQTDLKMKHI